ncbi:NUDIX domain-containing protein [Streptomyces sp. G1]|nr:NUDIX domain-containing protein [Streptomyces sp. G1]
MEARETAEQAAVREAAEETALPAAQRALTNIRTHRRE